MNNITNLLVFLLLSFLPFSGISQLELEYEDINIEYDTTLDVEVINTIITVTTTVDSTVIFHWEIGIDSTYQDYIDQGLLAIWFKDFNQCYTQFIPSSCWVDFPNEIDQDQVPNTLILVTQINSPELWEDKKVTGFVRLIDLSCDEEITSLRFHIGNDLTSTIDPTASKTQIYPNPILDKLTIDGNSNSVITIYNLQGQVIDNYMMQNSTLDIETDRWNKGTYLVKIYDEVMGTDEVLTVVKQ